VKEKSEPSRVLRVSMARYQHPPTISCGGKMESEKQWEMDKETNRND
jgi:hypothetical protein